MIKSISTQTGDFSYSLNLEFTGYDPFEFGWSGESKIFSFSGQSGRMYDNSSREFYSYSRGESLTLSGNKISNYNNYFVNDVLFSSNNSQNTGYVESFFLSGPVSPQITFKGNLPNYVADSGVLINGNTTGLFDVFNLNSEVKFKIYSGNFLGASGNLFSFNYPFDSGNITSFKDFSFNFLANDGTTGKYSVAAEFYTNFGLITQNFNIFSIYDFEASLFLGGPSFLTVTGNYDYSLNYDLSFGAGKSNDPYNINFEFKSLSGIGDLFFVGPHTGYSTSGNLSSINSGTIIESGLFTGRYITDVTGYNTGLGYNTGGLSTGFYSNLQWATGTFSRESFFYGSGLVTGYINSGATSETGIFLAQAPITGISFTIEDGSGNFIFSGVNTGIINENLLSGIFEESGVTGSGMIPFENFSGYYNNSFTGSGFYEKTGNINLNGVSFEYYAPSYQKTFSGEYNFYTGINTGNLIEMNYDFSNNLWSGFNTVTGENSFIMRIQKTKNIPFDLLEIFYSGQNNTTGGLSLIS